jgi:hypothetical protein
MSEELQIIPIEEQISKELVKHNVTQAVISTLQEKYGHLKINGIEDKETYLLVKDGRKECKAFRVAAKKICEKGREEAVAIQKAWVAKQKEVTDQIAAIEDPLEEQEKEYEAAVAKEKEDRKRKQEEQLIMRQQVLTSMGALYRDGSFAIGDVSFELSVVKESEQDIWEESILPKFKEEYEKVEAERIEQERIKQEREAEMKRQQEELERKQKELAEKEAALLKAQQEQERKDREEHDRRLAAAEAAYQEKMKARMDQLAALGMRYSFSENGFLCQDVNVHNTEMTTMTDDEWTDLINRITPVIEKRKDEAEQKRLAEIEAQKEVERINALRNTRQGIMKQYGVTSWYGDLGHYDNEQWHTLVEEIKADDEKKQREKWEKEQEEKRLMEEAKQKQELELAKDKDKWAEIIKKVNEVVVYEMRSSQYRKKAMILREKLEEIKAL